jgi:hypothetical protein
MLRARDVSRGGRLGPAWQPERRSMDGYYVEHSYVRTYLLKLLGHPVARICLLAALFTCGWLAYECGVAWGLSAVTLGAAVEYFRSYRPWRVGLIRI